VDQNRSNPRHPSELCTAGAFSGRSRVDRFDPSSYRHFWCEGDLSLGMAFARADRFAVILRGGDYTFEAGLPNLTVLTHGTGRATARALDTRSVNFTPQLRIAILGVGFLKTFAAVSSDAKASTFHSRVKMMPTLNTSTAKVYAGMIVAGLITIACTSADRMKQKPIQHQSELLHLPVAAGEDVISPDVVPVDIRAPCLPPILGGLGRYADVGWVSPRFFLVAGNGGPGYTFQLLPSGRFRFHAMFRVPGSEREANVLWDEREVRREPIAYCDIGGTLEHLSGTSVRRLAAWPVPFIKVILPINATEHIMAVTQPMEWNSGGPLMVSVELSGEEQASLAQDLSDSIGVEVKFIVSNRPLEPGCAYTVDVRGLPESASAPFGLREGENGAVAPDTLRYAISMLPDRTRRVAAEGTCPSAPTVSANCSLSGMVMHCRIDGDLVSPRQGGVANVETGTIIRR
jgi:hypothetical protein